MLGAFVPHELRLLTERREIQDRERTGICIFNKLLSEGRHLDRAAVELHAVIEGCDSVCSIAQEAPVEVGNKAVVSVIFTHCLFSIFTGEPVQRGKGIFIIDADRNRPLGLALPARDDPDAGQRVPLAGNLKPTLYLRGCSGPGSGCSG